MIGTFRGAACALILLAIDGGACADVELLGACDINGGAPVDREAAVSYCAEVRERFVALYGGDAPAGSITFVDKFPTRSAFSNHQWRFEWPTTASWTDFRKRSGLSSIEISGSVIVQHEIGHLLMFLHFGVSGQEDSTGYLSLLPDWFEEAAAIWTEPLESRTERLAMARSDSDSLPQLHRILTMRHPVKLDDGLVVFVESRGPCIGGCPQRDRPDETRTITARIAADGHMQVDTVFSTGARTPFGDGSLYERAFYPLAYAALEYVAQRGRRTALDSLILRLRRGHSPERLFHALPGLPKDSVTLQADWMSWLRGASRIE